MLLRSGDIVPPWGTPVMLPTDTPSSITPALNHIRISRSTLRSLTRRATNFNKKLGSRLPKKSAKSASTTHRAPAFTSLRMTSNASWAFRLGRNPNEHGRKLAWRNGSHVLNIYARSRSAVAPEPHSSRWRTTSSTAHCEHRGCRLRGREKETAFAPSEGGPRNCTTRNRFALRRLWWAAVDSNHLPPR